MHEELVENLCKRSNRKKHKGNALHIYYLLPIFESGCSEKCSTRSAFRTGAIARFFVFLLSTRPVVCLLVIELGKAFICNHSIEFVRSADHQEKQMYWISYACKDLKEQICYAFECLNIIQPVGSSINSWETICSNFPLSGSKTHSFELKLSWIKYFAIIGNRQDD